MLLLCNSVVFAQSDFRLPFRSNKNKIKFQFVNNLIIIPVIVNGVELSFILDTGVGSTIIFSVEDIDTTKHKNISTVELRGLGNDESVKALKLSNNIVKIGEALCVSHTIYQVLDKSINFSPRMGIVIHGVIGYDFFKNFVFDINYTKEYIIIHNPESYAYKKCRKCYQTKLDLRDQNKKPFITTKYKTEKGWVDINLLLDSGSGSSLWLFENEKKDIKVTENSFRDFLGKGFNGNIYGRKTKIKELKIGSFKMKDVKASFPDSIYLQRISLEDRQGSLGGDILQRFNLIIDYHHQKITFKKNKFFDTPFYYNMSGIRIQHRGFVKVKNFNADSMKEEFYMEKNEAYLSVDDIVGEQVLMISNNFTLLPRFEISDIRPGSPADQVGLKAGDIIIEVNGKKAYRYKLSDFNELFSYKEGRRIKIKIERFGVEMNYQFFLKKVI